MLNNKNIYIQLMFWFVNTVTNIQQGQKAKLDYHMSMLLRKWRAGRGWGLEVLKMFCQRGSEFFLLSLCVWGGVGGSGSVPLLP